VLAGQKHTSLAGVAACLGPSLYLAYTRDVPRRVQPVMARAPGAGGRWRSYVRGLGRQASVNPCIRCSRTGEMPAGPAGTARQAPGRCGSVLGRACRPCAARMPDRPGPRRDCQRSLAAGDGLGRLPGAGTGGRSAKRQTVRPNSRTCSHSTLPANTCSDTGTCRQRNPLSVADVQDTAELNFPVHSQTDIRHSS
jgi:hypothetical protein